ncbi:hypothetical protein C0Q70_09506 [Pomacea canaliculata]|uniref:Uncharacterized protein n=1 Tax=Pomacea canaliculata TaxID=400727 RepID=A0A2T7P9Z6_POMCA|nr:hypothetical protein C0Q70_09506 [Pomacea canaliculata]
MDLIDPSPPSRDTRLAVVANSAPTVASSAVALSTVSWSAVALSAQRLVLLLPQMVYVLVPITGAVVAVVLIYAYAAIPNASGALSHFFSNNAHTRQEHGIVYVQMQLGDAKMWLDALDLHLYGLGVWAGVLPSIGTHLSNRKVVINASVGVLMLLYGSLPHILLVAIAPYIDPAYTLGRFGHAHGVKPGLAYLFISIPHTFAKYQLSPFMAFLVYLAFILVGLHHLCLHMLMVWENVWPALPHGLMLFFRRPPLLLAVFCFVSFLLTTPYTTGCGIYLYQVVRFYIDRLLFALVIFSMVPLIIGYVRQELFRTPIERIWMGVWYGLASVTAASLLIYQFAVYVYPEAVVEYEQRWAEDLGWCVAVTPLLLGVVLGALHALLMGEGSISERFLGSLKMGRLPDPDNTDDYDSGETGDTALQGSRSPHSTRSPRSLHHPPTHPQATPLAEASGSLFPSSSGYGATEKAEVEVVMNTSKSCEGDIARV